MVCAASSDGRALAAAGGRSGAGPIEGGAGGSGSGLGGAGSGTGTGPLGPGTGAGGVGPGPGAGGLGSGVGTGGVGMPRAGDAGAGGNCGAFAGRRKSRARNPG